jgi:serine/threonine-protein phosphatase 4 regulatory subunit 1
MMQFLGPFIASFYPLEEGALNLPGNDSEFVLEGIGSQFFPHASSMVSRLNASGASTTSSPTPTPATLDAPEPQMSERQKLDQCLPEFITLNRVSYLTLSAVVEHRRANPPEQKDLEEIQDELLGHFCALSTISTGDDNTDAEMRVYCAYSYPAVVLLFGAENWQGQLQECFLALVNPNHAATAEDAIIAPPPLPVKRCLASSLHTVAHVLGPKLVETDILPVFRQHFLLDTDDSVRLNVIRNFPWLLVLLPTEELKSEYLSLWKDIVKGEDLLGAYKRSATNPMLLNWRQRNHVSRSLPDLIGLASATQVHEHIWPVLQMLLVDTVSLVREDAEWSIPTLLRSYCHENVEKDNSKRWSADCCQEVILWLKETILGSKNKGEVTANFSKRQLYCRICAAVGLALRFGDLEPNEQWDARYRNMIAGEEKAYVAYQTLSPSERKHLRRLLVYDLLPPALEMKTDRVTNVRLTLMKVLQDMPEDIRELASVSEVLQELEDEAETWESFTGGEQVARPPPPPQQPEHRAAI